MGSDRGRATSPREQLMHHVQQLEMLESEKDEAAAALREGFADAKAAGFDPGTLKVILKLRKMTPEQRQERRAMEAVYLATLGMLDGDPLTDEARRRLDGRAEQHDPVRPPSPAPKTSAGAKEEPPADPPAPPPPPKDPEVARQEGRDAAAAGKRIYDNPYLAGDPARAAWDEGWCERSKSNGMDLPAAYQRRTAKPPDKDKGAGDDASKGAE